jgi:hypothetical protein
VRIGPAGEALDAADRLGRPRAAASGLPLRSE